MKIGTLVWPHELTYEKGENEKEGKGRDDGKRGQKKGQ